MWPGNWVRCDRQQKLGVKDTDYVVIANIHTHTIVHKCDVTNMVEVFHL